MKQWRKCVLPSNGIYTYLSDFKLVLWFVNVWHRYPAIFGITCYTNVSGMKQPSASLAVPLSASFTAWQVHARTSGVVKTSAQNVDQYEAVFMSYVLAP